MRLRTIWGFWRTSKKNAQWVSREAKVNLRKEIGAEDWRQRWGSHGREEAGKQQVEKYLFNLKGNSFLKGLSSHLAYDRGWINVSFFGTPCFRLSAFSFLVKMTTEDFSSPWMTLFISVFVYFLMSCIRVKKPLRQILICLVVHSGCSIWNTVWYWVGVYCLSDRLGIIRW